MGGEERLAKHRGQGKLDARARIDHLLDPGSFLELGTLVGGEEAPADAIVMGSGRIDGRPGHGRRRGLHGDGGHDQLVRQLQALPRGRARPRRQGALHHDARGRRVPGRRQEPRRAHPDRPHLPVEVLGPGPPGHRGARLVGRSRCPGGPDLRLHRDGPARRHLHRRPAGGLRVARRADHQGGPRRSRRWRWPAV